MALFPLGRKLDAAKEYSLEEIPLFSSLTPAEHKLIDKKARLVEYKRGDIVYEEGTPPDAFYVAISGRFRLFTRSKAGAMEQTLIYFHRGDHFGETSLLTGQAHSATVEAKRDGLVLKLDREDFLHLVKEVPSISLHLTRSLGHRLTKSLDAGGQREVRVSALYTQSHETDVLPFWLDFSATVRTETNAPVVLVDFVTPQDPRLRELMRRNPLPSFDFSKMEPSRESDLNQSLSHHPRGYDYLHVPLRADPLEPKDEKKLTTLLTFLTYRYNSLLLRLPADVSHAAFRVLKQSDHVYVYCDAGTSAFRACATALSEFQQRFGFSKTEIRVIVPENRGKEPIPYEECEEMLGVKLFALLPSKTERPERYASTLRYLAREFSNKLLGLALGSGAAYGLAHIGVLRVLEQEKIPIDVIAGSSIGALIGALWAAGYDADALEKMACSIDKRTGFFKLLGFHDVSVAHRGFFKGHQIQRFLQSYLGDRTFQELRIPVKVTGVDLFTSEEVIFETGSVVEALRGSISIPGIFRPHDYRGRFILDGGVIDPLPVRVLTRMGVKKVIAVNVLSGPADRLERTRIRQENRRMKLAAAEKGNFLDRLLAYGKRAVMSRYAINIFNVIMSTVQFMEYEIAESWAGQADILIHPIVPEGHWAEFYSSGKFIRAGEEKTRELIEDIKGLLVE